MCLLYKLCFYVRYNRIVNALFNKRFFVHWKSYKNKFIFAFYFEARKKKIKAWVSREAKANFNSFVNQLFM